MAYAVITCHGCGLESAECPEKHTPVTDDPPCLYCVRNPEQTHGNHMIDFYNEKWTAVLEQKNNRVNGRLMPLIEDVEYRDWVQLTLLTIVTALFGGDRQTQDTFAAFLIAEDTHTIHG